MKRRNGPRGPLKVWAGAQHRRCNAARDFPQRARSRNLNLSGSFGSVSSLPLLTRGPDAKNLLATRLLVSLPTGRVASLFSE
jgi:hypothetical protein